MAGEANESSKNSPAMISPGFRSAAALAGWDEEALLLATLVVEDTPVRESRHKKHPAPQSKTPNSATSNRKRRSRWRGRSAASIPAVVLRLDDEERVVEQDSGVKRGGREEEKEKSEKEGISEGPSSSNVIPGMDRLREELSCAICLEICFEPSTTTCGHSFCKKCLENAASRCGRRCPKCRQLISGRSCSVNTVLWNTIQLLFPDEVELRKKTTDTTSPTNTLRIKSRPERANGNTITSSNTRTSTRVRSVIGRESSTRRREAPSQSEDAAMARRLQREEFMEAFRDPAEQSRHVSVYTASNNVRAMASRAVHFRRRGRFPYIID